MLPNRSSAFFVPSIRYSVELRMVLPIFYESHQIFFPDFVAPGFLPRINARQLSAFQIIECCSFAAMAKQAHLFLSQNIRHFWPINVIVFHNIHLCHLFGGRHLCMLCCSNIVLTFLTRILTKLPKSAHFWLSFEPLEKSSFFKGECQNTLIQLWFWADKTAWKRYEKTTKIIMVEKTRNQFASNRTCVRIPPTPPKKSSKLKGLLDFPFLSDSLNFPIFALERR